jgi:hypothetical protein
VADLAMYISPEEVLQLPPISHIKLPAVMPPAALQQYKQLEAIAILQLKEETLTAANAGVLTSKLRQFASGSVYTNAEHDIEEVHTAKYEVFDDLVEELAGEPLMVVYNFDHEAAHLLKAYPGTPIIRGGMSEKMLDNVMSRWNVGDEPLLFAQADAVAHGLNLQAGGNALCWFSQTYNLEAYTQVIARIYRQGQKNAVRIYHLITEGTIDTHIQKILIGKDVTQASLFAALRAELIKL